MRTLLLATFLLVFLIIGYCAIAQDSIPLVVLTSETVKFIPWLSFTTPSGITQQIELFGTAPGRIFSGTLELSTTVPSGTGEFKISMVDLAGISGTEITSGRYYYIPKRVSAAVYQNRTYDYITRKLVKP